MGMYINPGNEGFRTCRRSEYVDKSGLIGIIDQTIDTKRKLTLVSRARRFGKSMAAQMLCAYYDKSCDSAELFDDLEIAKSASYPQHRNQYDIIYLDITNLIEKSTPSGLIPFIKERLLRELKEIYPEVTETGVLDEQLLEVTRYTGNKFIAIIDEWDVLFRDKDTTEKEKKNYLEFLRSLFKSSGTTDSIFAAAYMTGILPMKKDGSQSAISEFREYTMFSPGPFAPFIGFTEEDVKKLCKKYDMDFSQMKYWYDGYFFPGYGSIYNSNSVMETIYWKEYRSYWSMSSSADSLIDYINMDFDGLGKAAEELLAGIPIPVRPAAFQNDPSDLGSKDEVLTLLAHYGYFSFDPEMETLRIPNEEIREEFSRAIRKVKHTETIRRVQESDQLLLDTIDRKEAAVAAQIEKIHKEEYTPRHYHSEQALRGVIKLAYFVYKDHFVQLEELPGGRGYADIVYLPKKRSDLPILLIELKWNKDAKGAIQQIKDRDYPASLQGYGSEILLIGINYDKDDPGSKHSCKIEEWELS